MDWDQLDAETIKTAQEILGYLNFSSGAEDPRFLTNLNALFGRLSKAPSRSRSKRAKPTAPPAWKQLGDLLLEATERFRGATDAFRQVEQARCVIELVYQHVLPGYRRHHRDLLFHQSDEALFTPLFLGRVFEAVLAQGAPWDQTERIVFGALSRLNDFIGHRPVAVLQNERKLQPYAHEWVRPIPLYVRQVGVGAGPYHDLISKALEILAATDPDLLLQAGFHPDWLDELALDPRAYDFDHPANKRPNHHFGQWDPHLIDNAGRYRRFVLEQVTLDAILQQVDERQVSRGEALYESAAVLAGTMLMASGVSGSGPAAHDSSTTLTTLLPHIAAYRDQFYEHLLAQVGGRHGARLRTEAGTLRQPFGGVRQRLNQQLAQRRARQLERAHLAQLYASLGYTDAALRQADVVSVASARITCQIRCRLSGAHLAIERDQLHDAAAALPEVEDLLKRGIECGALPDPWNILGFGAQFSLFPAVENSVHDHRIDELIELVAAVFSLYTRLQQAAVAAGDAELPARLSTGMEALARWWDKYASTEVSDVDGFSGREIWESSVHVADVLRAWFEAGTAAGDLAFWRGHSQRFHSPKAYALVVRSLLEQHDLVAAMALLIQWLSQSDEIPLVEQEHSFHELMLDWFDALLADDEEEPGLRRVTAQQRWPLARKLLDYLEANADEYWRVPQLELAGPPGPRPAAPADEGVDDEEEEDDGPDALFAAAYEDVTFRDSAADGFEGEMLQGGHQDTEFELLYEAERIADRLDFLSTLARLWRLSATALAAGASDRDDVLSAWLATATANRRQLTILMAAVDNFEIPPPRATHESMVEYDRRRGIKEQLLEQIIATCIETADAARSIRAAMERVEPAADVPAWEVPAQRVLWAAFRGDRDAIRKEFPHLLRALADQPLLYVALAKGGSPQQIVTSRNIQRVLRRLLALLPRLGLLWETYRLLRTILDMERNHAVGPGAITEFDQMFEIGCRGIVQCLLDSSETWQGRPPRPTTLQRAADLELIGHLERAIESLLRIWLDHSRRVRLSVLETVSDENRWQSLVRFIENYGPDLFTQKFMNLGNLRAILHRGADAWLHYVQEEPDEDAPQRLIADLDGPISRDEAAHWLSVAIEAVVESYAEYIDYNSTTTQSDRGDMLYTLLDFLRLQASYQRVAWNLRPIVLAHEILVRHERDQAAEIWRQAVEQRTAEIAEDHLERFAALSRQYGMRLPSIDQRLQERFIRPLTIDRLRALVPTALEELRHGSRPKAFELLQAGIEQLTQEPTGVGFDVPNWLQALEDEVDGVQSGDEDFSAPTIEPNLPLDDVRLTLDDVKRQVRRMLEEE